MKSMRRAAKQSHAQVQGCFGASRLSRNWRVIARRIFSRRSNLSPFDEETASSAYGLLAVTARPFLTSSISPPGDVGFSQ
jgi:hypothetical protein